jgi:hypothetical protein
MINLNSDIRKLSMDDLESVSGGGSNGVTLTFFGNTIHFGTDQTGASYISLHGADGTNSTTRGEPK